DHPQKIKGDRQSVWMPYAVAASLLLAVSAVTLNILQWQGSTPVALTGLDRIEQEYVQLRNPMVEEFTRVNESLDPGIKQELYRNFEIMEQARLELEQQVRDNPDNQRLVEMLLKVHEQELELLRQDYTRSGRSM
ncbi:MAG: hypothetical protein O3B72_10210, partial [Proteobacteria bacterium]|nr:hypothetical protein [Pseudomonadota bacterium]